MVRADQSMYNIDIVRMSSCILVPRTLRIFERHVHNSYEVHYVIAGRGSFELGGEQLLLGWAVEGELGLELFREQLDFIPPEDQEQILGKTAAGVWFPGS